MRLCKYLHDRADKADRMVAVAAARLLAVLLGLACGSCGLGRAEPSIATSPVRSVIVHVDESASIDAVAYRHWNQLAAAKLCAANTRVTGYAIDDVTSRGGLLADIQLPLPDRRMGWDQMRAVQAALTAGRSKPRAILSEAMTPQRDVRWSCILSAIDDVAARRPDATTTIVWFTDAVHSTSELDLEGVKAPMSVDPIVTGRGWTAHTLNGARVHIVLAAAPSGARPPLNDRRTLEQFWTAIITVAGGELVSFDTELDPPREA